MTIIYWNINPANSYKKGGSKRNPGRLHHIRQYKTKDVSGMSDTGIA
jgi:hypothetical protein